MVVWVTDGVFFVERVSGRGRFAGQLAGGRSKPVLTPGSLCSAASAVLEVRGFDSTCRASFL